VSGFSRTAKGIVTRRPAVMAGAAVLLLLSAALDAQWLKYPTPGPEITKDHKRLTPT